MLLRGTSIGKERAAGVLCELVIFGDIVDVLLKDNLVEKLIQSITNHSMPIIVIYNVFCTLRNLVMLDVRHSQIACQQILDNNGIKWLFGQCKRLSKV